MIVVDDRTDLDALVDDPDTTLLVLRGGLNSAASKVHDLFVKTNTDDWRHCALITDTSLFEAAEIAACGFARTGRYAVLGGGVPKQVAVAGPVKDLLRLSDGLPSVLKIRLAMAEGDDL